MTRHLIDPELVPMLDVFPTMDLSDEVLAIRRQTMESPVPDAPVPVIEPRLLSVPGLGGAPDVRVLVFDPPGRTSPAAILHIHGGGMVLCDAAISNVANATLAVELGMLIVSVDYRLAPECRFPGPQEDCLSAWQWLVAKRKVLASIRTVSRLRAKVRVGCWQPRYARSRAIWGSLRLVARF